MGFLEVLVLGIRAVQFVFAIVVLGLTGHIASGLVDWSRNDFLIFVSVWTMLVVLYTALTPKFFPSIAHILVIALLDALTMLFWFSGFIAQAVLRHDLGNIYYDGFDYSIQICGSDSKGECAEIAASAAFGGLEWLLFVVTLVLAAIEGMNQRRGKSNTGGGPVTSA